MMRHVRANGGWVAMIFVLAAVAVVCAGYILSKQRLASPFAEAYKIRAEFANSTAIVPSTGVPVNVAGVKVGQISGVDLNEGAAVLTLLIDPDKLRSVRADARATLVPNTPLKDMLLDLVPGSPSAPALPSGGLIPLEQTAPTVDADDLLRALDGDTRTFLQSLLLNLDTGTRGRAPDARKLLRTLGPTARQLRQITDLLAERRALLRPLVHNLAELSRVAGEHDDDLATVVSAGNATLAALSSEDAALRESVGKLPGTLAATRSTLDAVTPLSRELGPTLDSLMPSAARLRATLRDSRAVFEGGGLLPVRSVRRFIGAIEPLTALVPGTVEDLSAATPPLTDGFNVLAYTLNEIAYNPGESDRSYLYWLPWFAHNAASVFSTGDAHGAVVRGLAVFSCSTFEQAGPVADVLETILGTGAACQ